MMMQDEAQELGLMVLEALDSFPKIIFRASSPND